MFLGLLMATFADAQRLGGEWRLVEARQDGRRVSLGRTIKTTALFSEGSRMAGNAGCNRYSTTYNINGRNRIFFQPIIATKMACADNNFMKQENTFFAVIDKTNRYRFSRNHLILYDARERNVLRFVRVGR